MEKNMSPEEQKAIILGILAKEFDVTLAQLTPEVSLIGDLGADSLALINIMMNVEEQLGVDMPDEEWRSLQTVGDILKRLEDKTRVSETHTAVTHS